MKLYTLAICSLLILGAIAVTEEEDFKANLDRIRSDPFGKSIIDSIELKMTAEGNAEFLLDFLYQIEGNFNSEQKDDDSKIKDIRLQCEKDEKRAKTDIAALGQRITELTDLLNEKGPVRDEKEGLLKDKRGQETQITERINELDEAKAERDEEWRTIASEHDKATYIIESARQLLEGGVPTASFLQKKAPSHHKKGHHGNKKHHKSESASAVLPETRFSQLSQHINTNLADKEFSKKSWNHAFKTLAQITSTIQDSDDSSEKILNLFRILEEKVADSRELARKEHDAWVSEYDELKSREVKKLADVQFDIGLLQTEVSKLNKLIRENSNDLEDKNKSLRQKKTEAADKLNYCDTEANGYEKRRTTRRSNLNLTSDVIKIINADWRELKKALNK